MIGATDVDSADPGAPRWHRRTLSCQVVLDDERQRLLAHTDHDVTADEVRVASILARGATPEVRIWFEQWGILEATEPVRTPADSARRIGPRWVVPLRHDGMLLGFVSVLDRGGLTREQLEPVLASTAEIAETLYRRATRRTSHLGIAPAARAAPVPRRRGADVGLDIAAIYPHPGPIAVVAFAARLPNADLDGLPELLAAVRHACLAFPAATALYAEIARTVVALVPLRADAAWGPATRLAETVIGGPSGPRHRRRHQLRDVDGEQRGEGRTASPCAPCASPWPIPLRPAISLWDHAGAFRALTLLPVGRRPDRSIRACVPSLAQPQLARTVETFLDKRATPPRPPRHQIHRIDPLPAPRPRGRGVWARHPTVRRRPSRRPHRATPRDAEASGRLTAPRSR